MAEGERGCNKVEEPKANNQSTNNQPNICIQEREKEEGSEQMKDSPKVIS